VSELELIYQRLQTARCPEDVFGANPAAIKTTFHLLARSVHPDLHGNSNTAGEATRLLNQLRQEADARVAADTWGKRLPLPAFQTIAIGRHQVPRTPLSGDLADVYLSDAVAVKVARSHDDNDLIRAERHALTTLRKSIRTSVRDGVPELVDTLQVDDRGWKREANVLSACPGFVTAEAIHRLRPALEPENLVWMFKRLLVLLEWTHHAGLIHGAILPPHVLFYPDNDGHTAPDADKEDPRKHSLRLLDWCYSVEFGQRTRLSAWCPQWQEFYPQEIRSKTSLSPASDIYMAAKIIEFLGGNTKMPVKLAGVLERCLAPISKRPADAGKVFTEWEQAARSAYGTPKWFEFHLPK
jgi:hypothetical protein